MVARNRVVILCCALSGHAVNIIPFSYGLFLPYVYSYLHEFTPTLTLSDMHIHAPLCLAVGTGTAWTFGIFQRYVRERVLQVLNGLGLVVWMLFLYKFGTNYAVITFVLACIGFHAGQLHVYFSQRVTEEGKNYPGTANGLYGFFFGLAGIWGNILSGLLINPHGVTPQMASSNSSISNITYVFEDEDVLKRVPVNWLALAAIMFILQLPGFFFVAKTDNESERSELLKSKEVTQATQTEGERNESEIGVFSPTGMTLFLITIGIGVSSMSAFDLFKDYGLRKIDDDYFLNIAGAFIPFVGALGRIIWGILCDRFSFRKLLIVGNALTSILLCMMYVSRGNKYHYVFNTAILSVMPGMMTLLPPAIKLYMGTRNIALEYGLVLTGEVFGCVFYLLLTSLLRRFLDDLVLVLLLSIPTIISILPIAVFIREP